MYARKNLIFGIIVGVIVITIASLAALATYRSTQAIEPSAPADVHTCTPSHVGAFADRVHVRCSNPGQPGPSIYYFAFCSSIDPALASRYLSVFTTAKVTGKNLSIYYDPADTSGTGCGCNAGDCRLIWGVEVQP
jgi:hypothetical protein